MSILDTITKPYKVYADVNILEYDALKQFVDAMNLDTTVRGALMPDAHLGYSLPIGGVVETKGVVYPSFVGYDIGCGMCAIETTFSKYDIWDNRFDIRDEIYNRIPVGFNKRGVSPIQTPNVRDEMGDITDDMHRIYAEKQGDLQLGTLGGGNHFIEIGHDDQDKVWIVIHSGSRGVGHGCATHYMRMASPTGKASEGHYAFDVLSREGRNYINDMNFCLEWALWNRKIMLWEVIDIIRKFGVIGGTVGDIINRNHNHAESKDGVHWIHRKGATHAEYGMMGVIPGNMRDGSFIVRGLGNEESLCSSSHGAGRVLGRKQAKATLDVKDFEDTMGDIVAPIDYERLDESPFAYKNIYDVMELQSDLVDIIAHEKPMIVIKG